MSLHQRGGKVCDEHWLNELAELQAVQTDNLAQLRCALIEGLPLDDQLTVIHKTAVGFYKSFCHLQSLAVRIAARAEPSQREG